MRGLAALSVVLLHLQSRAGNSFVESLHIPLAVDFFFILSGFVLSLAYQDRLATGWSLHSFMSVRLIRLYPLYFLGLTLGLFDAWRLSTVGAQTQHFWWTRTLLGVFLLPVVSGIPFVFNYPSWSLLMELIANIFHGTVLRRGLSTTYVLLAASGAGVVWRWIHFGSVYAVFGVYRIGYEVPRVLFSYTVGVLLFRFWKRHSQRVTASPYVLAFVLLAVLMVPFRQGPAEVLYEAFVLLIVFPWLILAGASSELPKAQIQTANFLGLTSYAMYILHDPMLLLWGPLMKRLGWHGVVTNTAWGMPCMMMIVAFSYLADLLYDRPVQKFLKRILSVNYLARC